MKKAFVFDLDGTLLNSGVRISPKTYQALKKLKEEGHFIVIASGRMYASTMYVVENFLPFLKGNVIISSYNGGYIVNHNGKVFFEKGVSKESAVKCIKFLRDLKIHRHIYINDKLISEIDDKEIRDYSKHSFVDYVLVNDLISEIENSSHPTLKILAIGEPDKINLVKKLAEKEFQGEFNLMKSWDTYLDFIPYDVSKGNSLKIISKMYNLDPNTLYVFGDSENDIDMLELTKNSFAMGNAKEDVKKVANYLIPSNDEDGVAYAIEKILADDIDNVNI